MDRNYFQNIAHAIGQTVRQSSRGGYAWQIMDGGFLMTDGRGRSQRASPGNSSRIRSIVSPRQD
ncbi:hypothetical protein J6590_038036 [Homalodisca vitripennis]|nr:hypothetical protein J6590_038036 [Homalodisca vitripennis]